MNELFWTLAGVGIGVVLMVTLLYSESRNDRRRYESLASLKAQRDTEKALRDANQINPKEPS